MLTLLVRYSVAAGNVEEVARLLVELARATRAEPGNRGYEVGTVDDRPGEFRLIEHYVDRAAFDAHVASAHYNDIAVARIRPLLTDRRLEFVTPVPGT